MRKPVHVIGLGVEFPPLLTAQAQRVIDSAEVLIGGERLLAQYPDHPAQKITIRRNIDEILSILESREQENIVVLASGDPGFHGIPNTLINKLPREDIRILPHVSSLQVAFARIGVTWEDAILTSAHAHPVSQVVAWARRMPKLGILTDRENTPATIAAALLGAGIPDCRAVVAENLGTEKERIIDAHLSELNGREFADLNVLLVLQGKGWEPEVLIPYRDEEEYSHQRGMITKRDLRVFSIARMGIRPTHVLWDVGAGSGAMSVEMSHMAWQGQVFAVERDRENITCIENNRRKFGALNLNVIAGEAPEALIDLPQPQAVFIGGSGNKLAEILRVIHDRTAAGCKVVCNFATLENLALAMEVANRLGWQPNYSQVNIANSKTVGDLTRLDPLNPIFIFEGKHP